MHSKTEDAMDDPAVLEKCLQTFEECLYCFAAWRIFCLSQKQKTLLMKYSQLSESRALVNVSVARLFFHADNQDKLSMKLGCQEQVRSSSRALTNWTWAIPK